MIFKDPNNFKRSATKIAWHPETSEMRVGVTYSMLRFQQMPVDMPRESYIWNLNDPNFPEKTLLPPSPLCTLAFNHKNSDISWEDLITVPYLSSIPDLVTPQVLSSHS